MSTRDEAARRGPSQRLPRFSKGSKPLASRRRSNVSLCSKQSLTLVLCSTLLVGAASSPIMAQSGYSYGNPYASYEVHPGIGYWKARQDRAELRRYQGDPASQAILRQQRYNLCRNNPEVC